MKNILMNTKMAKAILEGRKTQTRRVIKDNLDSVELILKKDYSMECFIKKHSKFQKDEVIWVREPVKIFDAHLNFDENGEVKNSKLTYNYIADDKQKTINIPKRFWIPNEIGFQRRKLPEWMRSHRRVPNGCIKEMARIFIKITDVRVEKFQDMSFPEIKKEGVIHTGLLDGMKKWEDLWNKTAPKGYKWDDNPYVFVYDFEVARR